MEYCAALKEKNTEWTLVTLITFNILRILNVATFVDNIDTHIYKVLLVIVIL